MRTASHGHPGPEGRARRAWLRALDALGAMVTLAILVMLAIHLAGRRGAEHAGQLLRLDVAVLAFFLGDVVARFLLTEGKLAYLRWRWFDLVVLVALFETACGEQTAWAWFLARQAVALVAAFAGSNATRRLVSLLSLHPARLMAGSFAGVIVVGTVLLALPVASASGQSIGAVNAVFTATSAVCVTGLVVKDTGADFTLFGQLVILIWIQLGGLGIMTFSVAVVLMLGRTLSKSREVVMQDMLDMESVKEVVDLIKFIALSTFLIEAVGAVTLFFRFGAQDGYTVRNLYLAVFHSVSAFCNAGFSLFSKRIGGFDNLEGHCGDVWVNLTVTSLIIVGGLGFPVLRDLIVVGRRRRLGEGRPPRLRTHTKAVLTTTAALIVLGALLLYVLESRGALRGLAPGERVLASYFQSVTARTAGFNTVNIGRLGQATLVVLMCLMFIGASPGSTGGGIKTTTAAVLFQAMRSAFRGRPEVEMFGRTVPRIAIRRAMALVTLSVLLLTLATIALTSVENQPFERLLFEEVSAFGTVGLSAGATGQLTVPGRLIITFLMFLGRVGPLTLMFSLVGETRPASYRYPEARIMVG